MSSYRDISDRSTEPPEDFFVFGNCDHEIYVGEKLYCWEGEWICEHCLKDKVAELTADELADIFECSHYTVTAKRG